MDLSYQKNFFLSARLSGDFYYDVDNNDISRALLGKVLVRLSPMPIGGIIVETESYPGGDDKASHHWGNRRTERTDVIFHEKKGLLYVYKVYGMHHCFGITSGKDGNHNVTCIRALKPIFGIEEMFKRTKEHNVNNLMRGPAKVAKMLDITKESNGMDLCGEEIIVCDFRDGAGIEVGCSTRIGIRDFEDGYREKEWRFFVKGSECLSR